MAAEMGFRIASRGLNPAAVDQNRFDRFGNAMAANALRSIARHQPDDECADHRDSNRKHSRDDCRRDESSAVLRR